MTDTPTFSSSGTRPRPGNPFPGLRPFEPHESTLFFGRDEQCDALLTRLSRGRLVAVVGMSGSGKTSLVRAGLLPALDRGYLPSAGSSWHVAIFRPGSDPVANLTRALASRRRPTSAIDEEGPEEIRARLDASSLGLTAVARRLLPDPSDCLLVVADQFEEIFRFGRIARSADSQAQAATCVDLLINATQQDEVPVYVVLTMRSDYLGDCAHFTGLPEALNDSQFLVPRMTRAQLRAAIESPVAVGGARISTRLVQRLLYEVDGMSSRAGLALDESGRSQDQDQLPVLQHALMRVWEVSKEARDRGEPIDLVHYEQPPVETLRHALDRHAEEVYAALPSDRHREIARRVFQQLTDRDGDNREVRRPTPLDELTVVALRAAGSGVSKEDETLVYDVIAPFAAEGRAFIVVNAQQDVDISHESFIRKWTRLRRWVEEESRSRSIYVKLADAASSWKRHEASLYRGPELAEARGWWQRETPTPSWARRYHAGFEVAKQFLTKSVRGRRQRQGLLFGNIALLIVAIAAIAVLMAARSRDARRAEAQALEVRDAAASANAKLEEANRLFTQAIEAQQQGESAKATALLLQGQQAQTQANAKPLLTPTELTELERLRRQETVWQRTEADLRQQLAARREPAPPPQGNRGATAANDAAELERLKRAESTWERDTVQLQQQLSAATDRANRSQQAEATLKRTNEDLQARLNSASTQTPRPDASSGGETAAIEQVLSDYKAAYEARDPAAVARVWPRGATAELTRSFGQLKSYEVIIATLRIFVSGDQAIVTALRTISAEPKVGRRQPQRIVETMFWLKKTGGAWIIESVDDRTSLPIPR